MNRIKEQLLEQKSIAQDKGQPLYDFTLNDSAIEQLFSEMSDEERLHFLGENTNWWDLKNMIIGGKMTLYDLPVTYIPNRRRYYG